MKERLQKILSTYGVAPRRRAEILIQQGEVSVNGVLARLGDRADPEVDRIFVSGRPLPRAAAPVYIALYKPRGYITSVSDQQGRKTVMDLLPSELPRVYPVGRLDRNSEGLLLLTNDGAFANRVMHPSQEKEKTYIVHVQGDARQAEQRLEAPIVIDGYETRPAKVRLLRDDGASAVFSIVLHEGRNRQIRRLCEAAGLKVTRLKRVAIGKLALGRMKPGEWKYLQPEEIQRIFS